MTLFIAFYLHKRSSDHTVDSLLTNTPILTVTSILTDTSVLSDHLVLVPAFFYSLYLTLYKADISLLSRALSASSKGAHLRES